MAEFPFRLTRANESYSVGVACSLALAELGAVALRLGNASISSFVGLFERFLSFGLWGLGEAVGLGVSSSSAQW